MAYEADRQDLPSVTDWVNDWDWLDDQWGPNAIDIWNRMREQCPVATTERYGRAHMPVTMQAVTEVAHDTEHFSSIFVSVARPDAPRRPASPITSDPPDHHQIADTEVAGCPVLAGEQTLLTFPAANHDPAAFDDPHEFRIVRANNRHVAFGLGIHRCLGSNLARLELTIALQEWLRAFPGYEFDTTARTTWANGQIRGPRNIPVILNRSLRSPATQAVAGAPSLALPRCIRCLAPNAKLGTWWDTVTRR